ncbi:MAG: peptide-binding protein [Candidatus Hydrogenedentes bacterium]|nr:peptide-binding protein [Candidatus Hydrogenedentota bacterium]
MRISVMRLGIVVAVVALGLAGCGGPGTEPEPGQGEGGGPSAGTLGGPGPAVSSEPVDGDWLVGDLPAEMESLNPFTSTDLYSSSINGLIIERLLDRDNETLELEPKIAESWTISEDKLTYTFTMRRDVTFSDGAPLTAHDVKFSFDKLMDPTTDAPHARNYYQDVTSCEAVDDYTVRFTCNQPYFKHLTMLGGLEIIPEHIYGTGDFNNHPNNRNPIGSGPYILERWDTGKQVVLVRNENYWGEKPHVLRRVYKVITNADAAFQELARHGLDVMDPLSMTEELWTTRATAASFEAEFNKFTYTYPGYRYIGWNMRRPKFADKRVRRALTMLLDRETIRRELMYGLAAITTGCFFVDEPEYNRDIIPWPFDPEGAAALLDEAGWTDTDGDGLRDKGGEPFRFELQFTASLPIHQQTATVFQEELAAAGIEMSIRELEWASLLQNVQELEFDAIMMGWSVGPDPDPYQVWHSSQAVKRGSNHVGFVNAEADEILEKARLEFDRDARIRMYHRFHEILHEEQPYTFLFCRKALVAVDKRFQNTKVYPYGMDSLEWWVPAAQQRYTGE